MNRYVIAVLLPTAIALNSCSKIAIDSSRFQSQSTAYVREEVNSRTYVTENSAFHFTELLGDKGSYEDVLLLEERYRNENTPGIEGVRGDATIKAWTLTSPYHRESRWTVGETANEGKILERFFRLTMWGCCDAPNVYTYYSLFTGKRLYVSNSDLLEVRGDGQGPLALDI